MDVGTVVVGLKTFLVCMGAVGYWLSFPKCTCECRSDKPCWCHMLCKRYRKEVASARLLRATRKAMRRGS